MPTEHSDRLSLSYVMAAQAQKHVPVNETTRALDALLHLSVKSRTQADQPSTPQPGDGYILISERTGDVWASAAVGSIAAFQDNAWMVYAPVSGMTAYVEDEGGHVVWDGAAWTPISSGAATSAPSFGVNASADPTNKLAVKSDAILFTHDDVTPGTGDVRAVVNKSASEQTASMLFQTNHSARAEFGLTGTDDYVIKVSPDGSTFFDALIVDRLTGAVRFPNTLSFTGGAPAFAPGDIAGLVAWYDPSDGATLSYGSGAAIAQMVDKSGISGPAVQTVVASQPSLQGTAIGSRDAISFGGGSFLDISATAGVFSGDDADFSVHFVFQSAQTVTTQVPFGVGSSASTTLGCWWGIHSSGVFRFSKRSGSVVDVSATPTDTAPHVVSIIHTGITTSVWIDGVRVIQDAAQNVAAMTVDRASLGGWLRTAADFPFDGLIGEMLIYDRALIDEDVRQVHRYLGGRWLSLPTGVDLFLAMEQSNMMGKGDASLSPVVATGDGFEWTPPTQWARMADPVGGADTGSCFPAFSGAWRAATGRGAAVVNMAVGSTSLLPEADAGFGNWDKAQGTLYSSAIAAGNAALAALEAASIYDVSGVYALWAQGERDAENVSAGTPGVTAATYQTALVTLINNTSADLSRPLNGFFIFELGARNDGVQEAAWASVRGAQAGAAAVTIGEIIFTGAKSFPSQGLMADNLHYTQAAYNQMGTIGATTAATFV